MTKPFLYAVGWTTLDRWYLGVRHAAGCDPSDLWTKYFTSSERVGAFRLEHGEPDHVEVLFDATREQVLLAEAEALSEYQLHTDPRWLNASITSAKWHFAGGLKPSPTRKLKRSLRRLDGEKRRKWACPSLSAETVFAIYNDRGTQSEIAARHGVKRSTVSNIRRGINWNDITGHPRPKRHYADEWMAILRQKKELLAALKE